MISEFKEFINKGGVLEFAVAVIMAGVFGAVVTAFTSGIIMPPIGLAMGGVDFSQLQYVMQEGTTNAAGEVVTEEVAIKWGAFLQAFIDFLIVSFILFLIVRAYNRANPPEPPGPTQEDLLTEIRDALKKA